MKKNILCIFVMMIGMIATAKPWATGIPQDKKEAINFSNKADYVAFMREGKLFPINPGALYQNSKGVPMPWSVYAGKAKAMQQVGNSSYLALLNALEVETQNLRKDHGISGAVITLEDGVNLFNSSAVTYGPIDPGMIIVFDALDPVTGQITSIERTRHTLPKSKEGVEYGWFLKISGYQPILIKSAYCGNNVSSQWAIKHLVPEEDWGDDNPGDQVQIILLKKRTTISTTIKKCCD